MKSMDLAMLVKQPEDVTENPYRKPMKEGRKEKSLPSTAAEEVWVCLDVWCETFCMKLINLHLNMKMTYDFVF